MTAGRSVVQDVATTRRTAMQTDRSENDESRQPTATPKSDESANSTTENRGEATGRDHGLRGNATIGTVRGTAGGTRNRAAVGGSGAGIGRHGNLTGGGVGAGGGGAAAGEKGKKKEDEMLTTKTGGAYIPPARLR